MGVGNFVYGSIDYPTGVSVTAKSMHKFKISLFDGKINFMI